MKKQVLMMAALATVTVAAVNAQTRIGATDDLDQDYLPAELTSNGVALLSDYNYYNDDVIIFYDNNLTATEMQCPERIMWFRYFNLDNPVDAYVNSQGLLFSQVLFNNDAEFEYIRYTATNERTESNEWETYTIADITKLEAVTMSGTVLFTIEAPENTNFGDVTIWSDEENEVVGEIKVLRWGGAFYLVVHEYNTVNEEGKYAFYRINQQTQSIARVEGSLPISVFPSVANRSQTITVELAEDNNATEVQVVNNVGQVVKSIAVQPGQREVQLRAADLGSGMHIIGARSRKGQGACKIIVK